MSNEYLMISIFIIYFYERLTLTVGVLTLVFINLTHWFMNTNVIDIICI
jgi:uncharacterized membrane protein YGL010W